MNDEHDPVEPSFGFVQFLQSQECQEAAAQNKESVDAGESIVHRLKIIWAGQLQMKK